MERKLKNRIRDNQDLMIQELDAIRNILSVVHYQLLQIKKWKESDRKED